jgi:hypothetical protein
MEGLMQPTNNIANSGSAPRMALLTGLLVRMGIAVAMAFAGTAMLFSSTGAESTKSDPQQAGASNGGVASASTDGDVEIGQIVTGENTGNSIITGDISGPAEIDGGEIDYPTDVTVTQILGPPMTTADGGDYGTANVSDDNSRRDVADKKGGHDGQEITFINRNDNRNEATIVE